MTPLAVFQDELSLRRDRLVGLLSAAEPAGDRERLVGLLLSVDAALERLDVGAFGICDVCQGTIGEDRLRRDPLVTVCLECMTPAQSRALARDLETASRFQATLLPPRHVRHAGSEIAYLYQPFGAVSGDTIDIVVPEGQDEPLDVLFGDVSGKGIAASLLQSNLRALFRALAGPEVDLGELLAKLNCFFREATTESAYATLSALRLGPDGIFGYANAGHLPALRASGGRVEPLAFPSLPVGLFRDAEYAGRTFDLAVGESLLLYTDGLTEAIGPDGEEYGAARAMAAFASAGEGDADAVLGSLRADLDAFLAGGACSDDLALMVLRRVG